MADRLTPEARSRHMARIRGRDTKPEMLVRRGLFRLGLRYRLHGAGLPGRPDMVFPGRRAVILVHGCFWHGHGCPMFRLPGTRKEFWASKIEANRGRDDRTLQGLRTEHWRVLTVWECALRGPGRMSVDEVLALCTRFLDCPSTPTGEIAGTWPERS